MFVNPIDFQNGIYNMEFRNNDQTLRPRTMNITIRDDTENYRWLIERGEETLKIFSYDPRAEGGETQSRAAKCADAYTFRYKFNMDRQRAY